MKHILRLLSVWALVFTTADGQIAGIFSDGMVLQQGMPVPVWGMGKPGEDVTVKSLAFLAAALLTTVNYPDSKSI